MSPERWQEITRLFDEAARLAPDERAGFLDEARPDADVRREVEALLQYDASVRTAEADPLEHPPLSDLLGGRLEDPDLSGQHVGPYRLLERIATGGMGEVYRGVRADGASDQQVAIKLVRHGLDSASVLRRFRDERRTLANLAHPNIARLVDGGVTADGRPYLVMDFIDGVQIDVDCAERDRSITERLRLFLQVCAAVQYAHENLVIHRDIKPSNILVRADGTPVLLDFGIARVLGRAAPAGEPDVTGTEMRVLTPDYASPEHLRGEVMTTAADVYSLGVVLYELLAGRRPYTTKGLTAAEAERVVTEIDPRPPSGAGGASALRGDLDAIVLKALRKAPSRRYRSVAALAADVERHLAGRTVLARRDTLGYRVGKFVRRHRSAVAGGTIAAVLVISAAAGALWQAQRAREAARRASEEAALADIEALTAQRISRFVVELLEQSDPMVAPREMTLDEILARSAERIRDELDDVPAVKAELMCVLGSVYSHRGDLEQAQALFDDALAIRVGAFGPESVQAALSLNNVGVLDIKRGAYRSAVERLQEAARIFEKAMARNETVRRYRDDRTDVARWGRAMALANLGLARVSAGEPEAASPSLETALALMDQLDVEDFKLRTSVMDSLATVHFRAERLEEAATLFQREQRERAEHLGEDHPLVALALNNLGMVRMKQGRLAEAAGLFDRSLAIRREAYGEDHPALATALANAGTVRGRLGELEAAESHLRAALANARATLPAGHVTRWKIGCRLASVLVDTGQLEEAEGLFRAAIEDSATGGVVPADRVRARCELARCMIAADRLDEADAMLREAESTLSEGQTSTAEAPDVRVELLTRQAELAHARGRTDDARRLLREALDLAMMKLGPDHPETLAARARVTAEQGPGDT